MQAKRKKKGFSVFRKYKLKALHILMSQLIWTYVEGAPTPWQHGLKKFTPKTCWVSNTALVIQGHMIFEFRYKRFR